MNKALAILTSALLLGACTTNKQPNIILVMTDDQGYGDLSVHGSPDVLTPNLDLLHEQSIRFTDFQASPTCSPTRSAIMTGRAPFRNGITHTINERERMSLEASTIAELLSDNGYETGIFGKWHLGDEEDHQPENRGFTRVFIHGAGGIGQAYSSSCADAPGNSYFDPVIKDQSIFVKTQGFCTDVFFDEALRWIKTNADKDQPFFAYLVTNAPHGPFLAPESYKQKFIEAGYGPSAQGFYGMIENIDYNMGRLMKYLDEWGLEENTVLIFMTDNGKALSVDRGRPDGRNVQQYNAGMRGYKGTTHEGGTHVPFFIRWTGHWDSSFDIPLMASHFDLYPTLADITSIEIPAGKELDGVSLLPLIENPEIEWPDRYRVFHQGRWPVGAEPDSFKYINFAVRNERFRLVGTDELYDLFEDPGETNNIIDKHPEVVEAMMKFYEQWWDISRPLMVNEFVPMSPVRPFHVKYEEQMKNGGIPAWQKPEFQ
jgi:arylsulfatase